MTLKETIAKQNIEIAELKNSISVLSEKIEKLPEIMIESMNGLIFSVENNKITVTADENIKTWD